MTEPSDIDFELYMLKAYKRFIDHVVKQKKIDGKTEHITLESPFRRMLIETWRREQLRLIEHQYSLVDTLHKVLT